MKSKALPKPRNPMVQHLINRKGAGVHQQKPKAKRSQEKARLKAGCNGQSYDSVLG